MANVLQGMVEEQQKHLIDVEEYHQKPSKWILPLG
jgi:hypothetical protein